MTEQSTDLLPLVVSLPLIGAVLAAALPGRGAQIGILSAIATTAVAIGIALAVFSGGTPRVELGGWAPPLGIALAADPLSATLLAMANLVSLGVSVYAPGYFSAAPAARAFWPLWMLLWAALNGLFLAADLFNLYVTLELLGISAAALGALGGTREAVAANLRYLLVGLLGSMTYLIGVALVYAATGTLDIGLASAALASGPVASVAFAAMIGGLLLKAAIFPLHVWLPPAHGSAPAPVSAALSALVVKAAWYLVLRLWLDLFEPAATPAAGLLLGLLGAGAVLWGSWRAMKAPRLKLVAAYSTVAQIGYLFLFFPLLATADGAARDALLAAVVILALTHGLAKSALFLAAGLLQKASGNDRIDGIAAAARGMPLVAFSLALAVTALVGLPPSGTFLAKWVLISESIAIGQWWWVPVILAGTLMAGAYSLRIVEKAFAPEPRHGEAEPAVRALPVAGRLGAAMLYAPALLLAAAATVGLGLGSAPVSELIAAWGASR